MTHIRNLAWHSETGYFNQLRSEVIEKIANSRKAIQDDPDGVAESIVLWLVHEKGFVCHDPETQGDIKWNWYNTEEPYFKNIYKGYVEMVKESLLGDLSDFSKASGILLKAISHVGLFPMK